MEADPDFGAAYDNAFAAEREKLRCRLFPSAAPSGAEAFVLSTPTRRAARPRSVDIEIFESPERLAAGRCRCAARSLSRGSAGASAQQGGDYGPAKGAGKDSNMKYAPYVAKPCEATSGQVALADGATDAGSRFGEGAAVPKRQ